MDHGERLAKVETAVNEHRERMERIERDIARTYASIDALRDHTDHRLDELRAHTDRGLAEIRQELQKTTRWLVGLTLANSTAIVVMLGKLGGLF